MGHWFRIGEFELLVVSDGVIRQDAGATFGLVPRVMWEPYVPDIDEKYRLEVGLNSLVIRGAGKTVLVDTGCGTKTKRAPGAMGIEKSGALLPNLHREDFAPEDVDIVINSHLHFDHCGGNTVNDGGSVRPAFPRGRYLIQKGEWDAAMNPNDRTRGTYLAENFEPLDAAKQVELIDGDAEVLPGVKTTRAPGHTEDHVVVEIESGGDYGLYIGELSQHPVQLERLAWISAFDILPVVSLETKKRFVEKALEKNATLVSVHHEYPGVGRLTRTDGGKRKWVDMRRAVVLDGPRRRIAAQFEDLFSNASFELTEETKRWVDEYIDNFEFGLAFDLVVDSLKLNAVSVSSVDFQKLDALGRGMKLSPTQWVDLAVIPDENGASL